jgi:DNA-binding NarL/FixJ family response regulator
VYSESSLRTILTVLADAVPCAVAAGDLDRVFSLLLTSWLPSFLREGEAAVTNAPASGLDAEQLAIIDDAARSILSGCPREDLEVLRLKLDGVSDRRIGELLGLSRPTVSKRKQGAMRRLEQGLAGLDEPLRLAVVDRLGDRLSAPDGREP